MLIRELLETRSEIDQSKPAILYTDRFIDDARSPQFDIIRKGYADKLRRLINQKIRDPYTRLGKIDKPGKYNIWDHFYLKSKGGVITVSYKATPAYLILAAVTDHRPLDSGTDANDQFAKYLSRIENLDLADTISKLRTDRITTDSAEAEATEQSLKGTVKGMFQVMATNQFNDVHLLIHFALTGDIDSTIKGDNMHDLLDLDGFPTDDAALKTMQKLAQEIVKHYKCIDNYGMPVLDRNQDKAA